MAESKFRYLRNIAAIGLFASLLGGFFIPVYTDEIGWRFQERAGFDGVDKLFSDICGPNTLARPPFFMMPVRYFSSLLNGAFADPIYVRISGVLYALIMAALVYGLIRRLTRETQDRNAMIAFAFALMGIGMLPFLLVWSRPEQPILLCLLAVLPIGLANRASHVSAPSNGRAWISAAAVFALWIIAVSYHLKALFLFPVFALCLFYASQRLPALVRLAAAGLFLALTAVAMSYWVGRLGCPDSPALAKSFAKNSMGGALAGIDSLPAAIAAARQMLSNVTFAGYVVHTAPAQFPLSDWLAREQVSQGMGFASFILLLAIWSVAFLAGLWALGAAMLSAWRRRAPDRRVLLSLACLISLTGWSAMQNWINVYEAPFVLVTLIAAILLAFAAAPIKPRYHGWLNRLTALLAVAALANPLFLGAVWGPSLANAASQGSYLDDQPYSVGLFGYADVRSDIEKAAKLCGIPAPERAQGVLIDEVTYFAYMQSYLPQHRLGVLSNWNGEIDDPVAYLKSRNSDGLIAGCHLLGDDLRARAIQQGEVCCMAPPGW